jgi:hypothetical protein
MAIQTPVQAWESPPPPPSDFGPPPLPDHSNSTEPRPSRTKWVVVLATAGVLVVAAAATVFLVVKPGQPKAKTTAGQAQTHTVQTHTIAGTFTLSDAQDAASGCLFPSLGYSDITAGAQVTLTNQSQTVLGTGQLGPGVADAAGASCVFPFTILNVPRAAFYGLTVSHRGTLQYSFQDMTTSGWTVTLTLGQ